MSEHEIEPSADEDALDEPDLDGLAESEPESDDGTQDSAVPSDVESAQVLAESGEDR